MKSRIELKLLILLIALLPFDLHAKSEDHGAPVHIQADSVVIREKDGISTYQGNVIATRGSMQLKGDQITVYSEQKKVERIVVIGEPAIFTQLNDAGEEIRASGGKMLYEAASGVLTLEGEAEVIQNINRFSGPKIVYNTLSDTVEAGKDDSSTPSEERVTITIRDADAEDPGASAEE